MGGPSLSARAAACAAGSYNWGKLGIYCFHQRFGITEPARLRNFQLGGYRLWLVHLVLFWCYREALRMLQRTELQVGVSEMLSPLQQRVNRVTLSKCVPEHSLNLLWWSTLLRGQTFFTFHHQRRQQLSCSDIICVPFWPQPDRLSIMWLNDIISLETKPWFIKYNPVHSRKRVVHKIIKAAVDIDGIGISFVFSQLKEERLQHEKPWRGEIILDKNRLYP